MSDRHVTHSGKDRDGDITALCNPGAVWSPRRKHDCIQDIESGRQRYYVTDRRGARVDIHVVEGRTGKYLRTDPDRSERNNLDELPDC